MGEIIVPLNENRSPEEEQEVNKLLVAGLFGMHKEFNKLLASRMIKRLIRRGALIVLT
jgi:hypothetical protein